MNTVAAQHAVLEKIILHTTTKFNNKPTYERD
jgi:hypothetical protein